VNASTSPSPPSPSTAPADSFSLSAPVRLWEDGFAADPHRYYAALRAQGPLGWGELAPGVPAYIVTDRRAALEILHDPDTWSHDPRPWQATVAEDATILGVMHWRPNALYADGEAHVRFRTSFADAFELVEPHDLRERVHHAVDLLVGRFGPAGQADLVGEFVRPLMSLVFNNLHGLPDSESGRLEAALGKMMEGGAQAATGEAEFAAYVLDLVAAKSAVRGPDITSWLLDHPADLTPEEVIGQVLLNLAAGHEPTANLMSNALSRIVGNPDFYSTLTSGSRPVMDAVLEVLRYETPMANFAWHYARESQEFHGVWVQAAVPVVISFGALGHFDEQEFGGTHAPGDASHLSWSAGPHACPVKQQALLIVTEAIERLTQWLPDLEPVTAREHLVWRPGPFQRSLQELPVRFTARTPDGGRGEGVAR
jgi:cytochrome P450